MENAKTDKGKINHFQNSNVQLTEDVFGIYYDAYGFQSNIKRFTWKSHNRIEVQVMTFGARITSIKMPDRKGIVEDIVMGFDDLAGYRYFDKYYFGATIGRVADYIKKSTFHIDGKQYWLSTNDGEHHFNGGNEGFDKAIWTDFVDGTTVILSHVFPNNDEGYPGDLFVRIFFQLLPKNEFTINMEAYTTKPTIINMSNLLYFNLAGHHCGSKEIYKHTITMNSNCFTETREDGLPSGLITNVIHTSFDYQIPKRLGNVIGINPGDGINQHLCVNRGVFQDECFVARVLHSPSGRMLEIYSNQPGVRLSTANHFPTVIESINSADEERRQSRISEMHSAIDLVGKLHLKMMKHLHSESTNTDFSELRDLIRKIQGNKFNDKISPEVPKNTPVAGFNVGQKTELDTQELLNLMLNPLQMQYLEDLRATTSAQSLTDYQEITDIIQRILDHCKVQEPLETDNNISQNEYTQEQNEHDQIKHPNEESKKVSIKPQNEIPQYYTDGKIHGKNGAIYSRHGAICVQTQNYPNAVQHKNFPNCILRPNQVYKHTITYKFWIRAGNPNNFIRRYNKELKKNVTERHIS